MKKLILGTISTLKNVIRKLESVSKTPEEFTAQVKKLFPKDKTTQAISYKAPVTEKVLAAMKSTRGRVYISPSAVRFAGFLPGDILHAHVVDGDMTISKQKGRGFSYVTSVTVGKAGEIRVVVDKNNAKRIYNVKMDSSGCITIY